MQSKGKGKGKYKDEYKKTVELKASKSKETDCRKMETLIAAMSGLCSSGAVDFFKLVSDAVQMDLSGDEGRGGGDGGKGKFFDAVQDMLGIDTQNIDTPHA